MGLLDVLNGMQNGPRGQTTPGKGGMSPITMAILALLAYKGIKHLGGNQQTLPGGSPRMPGNNPINTGAQSGGGLGDILGGLLGGGSGGSGGLGGLLQGGLGGLLAGGASGGVLSGGLNDLLKQFQDAGHGDTAKTWVGTGDNKEIAEGDLAKALGADQINTLMQHTGLSRQELLSGLSQQLPQVIDQLTPEGRVPTGEELSGRL